MTNSVTQAMPQTALTPEMQAQLDQLKGLHLPEPISWWPLAMGWWMVIAVLSTTVIVGVWWYISKRRRLKKSVLAELQNISADNPVQFMSELSALLRRVAMYRHGNSNSVHNLSGDAWAKFLNQGDKGIDMPLATLIANAPYSGITDSTFDANALRKDSERWIIQNLKRGKR